MQAIDRTRPIIFISHRNGDSEIAKTLKRFILEAVGDQVEVFFSSDDGPGCQVGQLLSSTLAQKLRECSVVLLIYTRPEDDWTYCMWECGVAFDPDTARRPGTPGATKTIVLRFTPNPPSPLNGLVNVDARAVTSVAQFVCQLMTSDKFFPNWSIPLTQYDENHRIVKQFGQELYELLAQHSTLWESENKWSVWPRMMLELDLVNEQRIKREDESTRQTVEDCTSINIKESSGDPGRLFGVSNIGDRSLGALTEVWRTNNQGISDQWIDSLVNQIIMAVRGIVLVPSWELMNTATMGTVLPIVLSCIRVPHQNKLYLEVYFLQFHSTLTVPTLDTNTFLLENTISSQSSINRQIHLTEREDFHDVTTGMRFLWVEGGMFQMGSNDIENVAHASPCHPVRISSFWIGETPITREQYQTYLRENNNVNTPSFWLDDRFSHPQQPVVGVSWDDAVSFCEWLQKETGLNVVLPTEAQWEYVARSSDGRRYPWGNETLDETRACFGRDENSGSPCIVGSFINGRGYFETLDQSGNVWEWCRDAWNEDAYQNRSQELEQCVSDPVNISEDTRWRSLRGGGWDNSGEETKYLQSAYRMGNLKNIQHWAHGFRVAVIPTGS
jgi:formylglycine-generating enzyme required for sulfatase activity